MGHPSYSRWRTNSHGHIARSEYPKAKPVGEFRIAVIGDWFTAGLHKTCAGLKCWRIISTPLPNGAGGTGTSPHVSSTSVSTVPGSCSSLPLRATMIGVRA